MIAFPMLERKKIYVLSACKSKPFLFSHSANKYMHGFFFTFIELS